MEEKKGLGRLSQGAVEASPAGDSLKQALEGGQELYRVEEEEAGDRLDVFLRASLEDLSRSQIAKAIQAKKILLNGKAAKPSSRVKEGDQVALDRSFFQLEPILPEAVSLDILYEDEDLLAINKPAGMLSHPTATIRSGSLVNALLGLGISLGSLSGQERLGIVHRLDRETTGVILAAKSDGMQEALMEAFRKRQVHKTYLAILEGKLEVEDQEVENFLGRDPKDPKKQAILPQGRYSHSLFHRLEAKEEASLVAVEIFTGRTHQIRVHARSLGHPVVGDKVYGFRKKRHKTSHQLLHAWRIAFSHPFSGKKIFLQAQPDAEFLRMGKLYGFSDQVLDQILARKIEEE